MRIRALLLTPAMIAAAVLGLGAGGASAATLYTTSAHTTTVAVGTAASATATTAIGLFSGTSQVNSCTTSTLGLVIRQNSGGKVTAAITSSTFSNCVFATTGNHTIPWTLTVGGAGEPSTGDTVFTNVTVDSVSVSFLGGTYTGTLTDPGPGDPPVNGVYITQPAAGAPACVVFNNAGTLSGPLTASGRVTGTYCFENHPATTYSLT